MNNTELLSPDLLAKIQVFKTDWYKKYQDISNETTPKIDGNGKPIVKKRPDGYDYIEESHMRNMLDKHFPGWSWEGMPITFLGAEWVVGQGHLIIIDEYLLAFNINPPTRKFFGIDSVRIQYRTTPDLANLKRRISMPHVPENIVDIGDNCKSVNTSALKYATNRMCRIGDDVYGKRTEYEGSGSIDNMFDSNPNAENFSRWISEHKGIWSDIFTILSVKSLDEITDFEDAKNKIKVVKKW